MRHILRLWKGINPVLRWVLIVFALLTALILFYNEYKKHVYKWTPLSEEVEEFRVPVDDKGSYALFHIKKKYGYATAFLKSGKFLRFHWFYPSFVGEYTDSSKYNPKYKDDIGILVDIHYLGPPPYNEGIQQQRREMPEPKIFDCKDPEISFYHQDFRISVFIPIGHECNINQQKQHIVEWIKKFIDDELFQGVFPASPPQNE